MPPGAPKLPPGLDPVTAGRWGLWLLAKRSHIKAQRRTGVLLSVGSGSLSVRFAHLWCSWTVHTYPGPKRLFAMMLGLRQSTANTYLYQRKPLARKHQERMLKLASQRLAQWATLVSDLEASLAADPPKRAGRVGKGYK